MEPVHVPASGAKHRRQADARSDVLRLQLLEHRVRVDSEDRGFLHDLGRCFDASVERADGPSPSPSHLRVAVTRSSVPDPSGGRLLHVESQPAGILEDNLLSSRQPNALASALTLWAVMHSSRYHVFHAGVVARGERGILLPASSGSGKSTLTAALTRHGYLLLSDEVCAIDRESQHLAAYPRALWLRRQSLEPLGLDESSGVSFDGGYNRVVAPAELGTRHAGGSPSPDLIVFPRFQPDVHTEMERLRPGPAVIALMECYCSQRQFKVAGLDLVIDLARRLPCYRLVFSDLDDAIERIGDALGETSTGETSTGETNLV